MHKLKLRSSVNKYYGAYHLLGEYNLTIVLMLQLTLNLSLPENMCLILLLRSSSASAVLPNSSSQDFFEVLLH
jgi:hypothetical protein